MKTKVHVIVDQCTNNNSLPCTLNNSELRLPHPPVVGVPGIPLESYFISQFFSPHVQVYSPSKELACCQVQAVVVTT